MTIAIPEAITTLAEAERRFGLSRTEASGFFPEWQKQLPNLAAVEEAALTDPLRKFPALS